jgi:hypothetical protein
MYVQLDKEKPGIGNIRGLNLSAVKSTTDQVSDCRFWGLNKLRHRLLHNPALTEVPVYIRKKCEVIFVNSVWNVYIFYAIRGRKKNNVTSGGVSCSEWTPIYIKKTNPSLINKEDRWKKKKSKDLDIEQIYGHGPSVARCQVWACRLVAGIKLLLLLESFSWEEWKAGSSGQGHFGNPEEEERPPLEAATK